MAAHRLPPPEPLFLDAPGGARFCLYHATPEAPRAALVYLHPFAEELNKSRRAVACTARALAANGVAVLQIDVGGCGDSGGEFVDASWDGWLDDTAVACAWLADKSGLPVGLWGLRLGATLALDYAASRAPVARLLLWQPVASGATFLTQFLRLRLANAILQEGASTRGGTEALREDLRAGQTLDIAGYELAPKLALALDGLDVSRMAVTGCKVDWFEVVASSERPLAPATARTAWHLRALGVDLHTQTVAAPQFWNTQEIEEAPGLLAATLAVFAPAQGEAQGETQ
ncbi:hydrolase 2, exosortase A system-associated [Massilia sp. 9I]|uniref:hydrolase 2, exosortase A system-associated n=1 Tax=Massilia sp. 9I TaxID=2653152 RepID=UPI0012F36782|nr:hydrolase 2, exosortase A system-associated [Massilia sp. 9I]VXC21310.1 Hydrolase 2, exosortase A system-associated [Massilia sp. 9I]